jgi:signal transduction histidine kinase
MSRKEKITENIQRAKSELNQALNELEKLPEFASGEVAFTAHALNNYLMVTECTTELLLHSLKDHPDPNIKRWLDNLAHVSNLMRHKIRQFLNSSEDHDSYLQFSEWDLLQLVRRGCNFYKRIADRKNISIIFEPAEDIPPVLTDPMAAGAVLDNILSNAVKFSFPGKQIWVKIQVDSGKVLCSIRDQGPGLSQEDQSKLYQRGVQLSAQPTGGEPSSGYGLAVAKDLIEKLGGDLWCESTLGEGACFSFQLPVFEDEK